VPAYGRQEVAVLQRGRPGLQILRAPRAPRPQPFKKACGSAARRRTAIPATGTSESRRWLPEPHPVPNDRRRRCWPRWRRDWHVRLGVHCAAAHGQCRSLRDCGWWREQRSQVNLSSILFSATSAILFPCTVIFLWLITVRRITDAPLNACYYLLFPLSCLIASVDSFGDLIAAQHQ
jgi:hypothetical protein